MRERTVLLLGISTIVAMILVLKFFGPEQKSIGPIDVSVVDINDYTLPYVRVEIEDLKRDHKSKAQNVGRYFDGPFFEGRHRVIVKLGEDSNEMNHIAYDKIHNFTKDTKTLGIRLENVRQRFEIEVAEQEVKIPVLPYAERKNIVISTYKQSGQ